MTNRDKRFLAQFAASRKSVQEWPEWMRQNAHVASATLPAPKPGLPEKNAAAPVQPRKP